MLVKFNQMEYKLNESQIQRFQLFKDLKNDTVVIDRFEPEFKDMLDPDFKLDFSDPVAVERYHAAASYFGDHNLLGFYRKVYEYELQQLKNQIQQFYAGNLHTIMWQYAINNPNLSDDFYEKYMPKEHYPALANCKHITSDFIERHINDFNWFELDNVTFIQQIASFQYNLGRNLVLNGQADLVPNSLGRKIVIRAGVDTDKTKEYNSVKTFLDEHKTKAVDYWYSGLRNTDSLEGFAYVQSIFNFAANAKLSTAFIEKYKDKLNWSYLSANPHLPIEFWNQHMDKIDMKNIWRNFHVTQEFAAKHIDQVEKSAFSQNPNFSEEFYEQHLDKIDWNIIYRNTGVSREFLAKYEDRMNRDAQHHLRMFDMYNSLEDLEGWFEQRGITDTSKLPKDLVELHETSNEREIESYVTNGPIDLTQNPRIAEKWFGKISRLEFADCYLRNPGLSPDFFRTRTATFTRPSRYLSENTFTYYKQKQLSKLKKYSFDCEWKVHAKIPEVDYTCHRGIS